MRSRYCRYGDSFNDRSRSDFGGYLSREGYSPGLLASDQFNNAILDRGCGYVHFQLLTGLYSMRSLVRRRYVYRRWRPDHQHGNGRRADEVVSDAAQHVSIESGSSVSADDNEIDAVFLGVRENHSVDRRPVLDRLRRRFDAFARCTDRPLIGS